MTISAYTRPSAFDILLKDFFNSAADFTSLESTKVNHPVDIYENSEGLHFEVACTGIDKSDIEVQIEGDILRVKYNKPTSGVGKVSDTNYLYRSINRRSFNLGYRLAARYDLSNIKASFDNGLLILSVPLVKEAKPKTVKIG